MLTLYYKPTCPYCQRVRDEAASMGIDLDLQDITAEEATVAALIEKGGKKQVPFLVDSARDEQLYESGDIMAYLEEHYAAVASAEEV